MMPFPFSEMDRTSAYAKACVLGDVEALPELCTKGKHIHICWVEFSLWASQSIYYCRL